MCITFSMYSILFYTPSKSTKISVLFVLYMFPPKARLQLFCFRSDIFPLYYGQSSISSRTRFVYCLVCWEGKMKLRKTSWAAASPCFPSLSHNPSYWQNAVCDHFSVPNSFDSKASNFSTNADEFRGGGNPQRSEHSSPSSPRRDCTECQHQLSVAQLLSSSVALTLPPLLSHPCVPPTPTASSAKVFPLCA